MMVALDLDTDHHHPPFITTRKTVIGYVLSTAVHLELLSDHISITIQYLKSLLISY
jgi:hypothetical protein